MARKNLKPQFTTYSNLTKNSGKSKRAIKKNARAREKAEYLATLPKNPVRRFFAHFEPKRMYKYWFSKRGLKMLGKIVGISVGLLILLVAGLVLYFRQQLGSIDLANLQKNVQTTVTTYYDRNGNVLWEDTGAGNYRLVVESDQINQYMKDATVAIEDKNFYKEKGVSLTGMVRAFFSTVGGGQTQGASTLTQQLIKQVYFADEAGDRGITGIPRKIKEAILSTEADQMYPKDQILTMYLNESPYGGRRNGVESAAQTYFGKDAKDLTLPEAALLASIPQNPSNFNPYIIQSLCTGTNASTNGCSLTDNSLIRRQHTTLDYMADQGYISRSDAENAKKVAILDEIKPLEDSTQGAKAPHFIQMVKQDLIDKLGAKVVGQGGLKVTTTLDERVQGVLEDEMNQLFNGRYAKYPVAWGADDASFTMTNNQGQIIGLMGSRGYDYPGYGSVNMANSFVQPGSTIKPLVYASLINNQNNPNGTYGAGSMINDTFGGKTIQQIYGAELHNDNGSTRGNYTIRNGLAQSQNLPAVMSMHLNGVDNTKQMIRDAGDVSYCTDGADQQAGLSAAIGGCGAKQIEHAAAFSTLANNGKANPSSDILKVVNSTNQTLYEWKAVDKQVFDPQTTYIISDILSDQNARKPIFGACPVGECFNGIKTATKTGTSNIGNSSKDIWMMSYTPVAVLSVWAGNHTPKALRGTTDGVSLGFLINDITNAVYKNIFEKDGTYKANQWFTQPSGIQKINGDIYPSWYNKSQAQTTVSMKFDRVSKKLATACTPALAIEEQNVIKSVDPITKKTTLTAPDGYDANHNDGVHACGAHAPFFDTISASKNSDGSYTISALFSAGDASRPIQNVSIKYNGQTYSATSDGTAWSTTVQGDPGTVDISATAVDNQFYSTDSGTQKVVLK